MTDEKDMTFDEKVALSKVVEKLPVKEHPNIYRIVNAMDPGALVDCEDDTDWTYVYFHLLKPSTLRELESYVASRDLNTQSEIKENNPDLEKENSAASTSYTEKLRSSKGAKGSAEEGEGGSIKARLRRSSRKSDPGSSKEK